MTSRRGFLIATGAAVVSAGLRPGLVSAQGAAPAVPGKDKLIIRSPRPINLEARINDLVAYQTPEDVFFVRNNLEAPSVDPSRWSLRFGPPEPLDGHGPEGAQDPAIVNVLTERVRASLQAMLEEDLAARGSVFL